MPRNLLCVGRVTIRLLGGFAALVDGEAVPEQAWRLKKARELVKLLGLAPRHQLHREQVMDLLWRERDPAAAANNLYQVVHAARRALGADAIELRDELLRLRAEVDVERFDRAVLDARRAGTPAAYRAALSLYRGELLPENRYDDWAEARRNELAELQAALAEELSDLGAIDGLRGLPAETSSFVGRQRELRELRTLLQRTRLLTLTGAGGAGKTRLALELARVVEASFSDGAVLVELAPIADPALVVHAVGSALDVQALPGRPLVDALADFVAARSLLVILDNCEHVLGAAASLEDRLLRAAPQLTIVATSREPLRVPAEIVFRVPSLRIPDPDSFLGPSELLRYEAVRLFIERAAAAAPGFELDAENAADVARICFRLDGLPLALELAAGRVGALEPAAIAARLDDRFRLLRAGSSAAPTRQQTLEATLDWSHDLLSSDERVLFRRLAVFAGSFDLAAAEAVCAGDAVDPGDVADLLARLVEKSLVNGDDGRAGRYRLLETVRLYASRRLADADEARTWARRHADWALTRAEREHDSPRLDPDAANFRRALDRLLADDPPDALRLCIALWPFWLRRIDLDEAHRRFDDALAAVPGRTPLRADALLAAAALDLRAGRLAGGKAYAEESLTIAQEIEGERAQWRALLFLGGAAISNDDCEVAVEWFERALDLARAEGFAAGEALCIYSLGVAHWRLGDLTRAEQLVAESIEAFRMLGAASEQIPSPLSVAEIRTSGGADAGMRIVFEDTLQPFVEISCGAAAGYALANQAGIVRERGDLVLARELLEESTRQFAHERNERGQADVLVRLAYLELAAGSSAEARSHLQRALELRRRMNERRGVGMALAGLGLVETAAGDYDRAEERLAEARDLFRRAGDRWGLTGALWNTADLAIARGDLDAADAALEEARAIQGETGRARWVAQTLARLAETALLRADRQRAESLLAEARELYAAKHDEFGVADVDQQLRALTKPLRARKGRTGKTSGTHATERRRA